MLPAYYSSLREFREFFGTGVPILTYHKLGPRRRTVRLKGLYLSRQLFSRQLNELHEAGFASTSLDELIAGKARSGRHFVLTFDDGFRNVSEHAAPPLAQHGFQAVAYLVADLIGKVNQWEIQQGECREPLMDAAQVRDWLAAEQRIGSHTLTHPFLTQLNRQQAREEISASKKKLEDIFSRSIDHFCYPYGDWNESVRELVIEAGYRTACTTDFGVNDAGTSPFALKRITARYRSRNWKGMKVWLVERWAAWSH